jgi:tRNA threonylcarbamoyladenosine modification (KEOPS) complex Cgi121 subunit
MAVHARAFLCGRDLNPTEVRQKVASANRRLVVQAAAAGSASNEFFVEMLAAQTIRAEASGSMLARKPELDLLLRLAGTTQISKAIAKFGATEGKPFLLIIAGRDRSRAIRGVASPELPRRELTRTELQRVERAALLNAQRA